MRLNMEILKEYEKARSCWQNKELTKAASILQEYWRRTGERSLPGMLLMAYILRDKREYVSEIKILHELLQIFSDSGQSALIAEAWSVLGSALRMLGESRLSVAAFCQSGELEPDVCQQLVEISNALFSANAIPEVDSQDMQELYATYRRILGGFNSKSFPKKIWRHERLRIGYMSADFRQHAVGQFVRPLFYQYDRRRFTIYAYSLSNVRDEVTDCLQQSGAIWRNLAGARFETIAQTIRADEIDILVDLSGHTAGNALPVFSWQPALVQISGIGYFNSTGLKVIDGFLSDKYCSPIEHSPYFTETLIRLPHSHFCYQPWQEFPELKPLPSIRNGYITFGCFNNFAKVTDRMLMTWQKILAMVPDSRLLLKHGLFDSQEGLEYTRGRLQRLGLPLARIELRGLSADYLEQYRDMDIALDTSPYSGGLTTCEALYMGVPVVSLIGDRHGARFGYSFLSNLGLPELAAHTEEDYVQIAVQLAADRELLVLLHAKIRSLMRNSPLMDGRQYMRDLENLYCQLFVEESRQKG